jgi:threonine/homoserine/homoserine lactone efflux protein
MYPELIFNKILFVFCAYIMGFFAAVPVGASQLEIAKRALKGYLYSAMMIGVGTTLSDVMYGAISFFGIAPFLKDPTIIAIFRGINSVILIVLGLWAIFGSKTITGKENLSGSLLKKKSVSVITGFTLALTNPMIMLWWLVGFQFVTGIGLIRTSNIYYTIIFLLSGTAGILSYALLLSFGIYKSKKFFSDKSVRRITITLGYILLCLAIYFAYLSYTTFISL